MKINNFKIPSGLKKCYKNGIITKRLFNIIVTGMAINHSKKLKPCEEHSTRQKAIEFGNIMRAINAARDRK